MSGSDLTFTLVTNGRSLPEELSLSPCDTLHALASLATAASSDCDGRGHGGDYVLICGEHEWLASDLADESTPLHDIQALGTYIVRAPKSTTISCYSALQPTSPPARMKVSITQTVESLLAKLVKHNLIKGEPATYSIFVYPFDRYDIGGSALGLRRSQRLLDVDCAQGAIECHRWEVRPSSVTLQVSVSADSAAVLYTVHCSITERASSLRNLILDHALAQQQQPTARQGAAQPTFAALPSADCGLDASFASQPIALLDSRQSRAWNAAGDGTAARETLATAVQALGTTSLLCVWDVATS